MGSGAGGYVSAEIPLLLTSLTQCDLWLAAVRSLDFESAVPAQNDEFKRRRFPNLPTFRQIDLLRLCASGSPPLGGVSQNSEKM